MVAGCSFSFQRITAMNKWMDGRGRDRESRFFFHTSTSFVARFAVIWPVLRNRFYCFTGCALPVWKKELNQNRGDRNSSTGGTQCFSFVLRISLRILIDEFSIFCSIFNGLGVVSFYHNNEG